MSKITSVDQLGNTIEFDFPPQRIVSLVPSQTELLFDLDLDKEIFGITRFCIHPEDKVSGKQKIGGTKQFAVEKIKSLQPDLIIGNKEENYEEGIAELKRHFPVWMSDIYNLADAYAMMKELSRITNRETEGEKIVAEIKTSFNALGALQAFNASCAYFIWRKPYMVAAVNTFIDHMLKVLGLRNVFGAETRYPEIEPAILSQRKPDFVFLSSEPYSFSEKHIEEFRSFYPAAKVVLVNGEMFSWYGSRLRLSAGYFTVLRGKLQL